MVLQKIFSDDDFEYQQEIVAIYLECKMNLTVNISCRIGKTLSRLMVCVIAMSKW